MTWTEDFSAGAVKAIGAAEALGAIGLILPAVTGVAPVLVPLAATGLALAMIGAAVVHARRGETQAMAMAPSVVLLILTVVVAWGRFGPYAF
ncbi:DoxX family protein [Actinoplanes sp. NEAU-A12]|uniref:DoxX family protein n=1 Tax=Actinoplanes sandaracinus TaxID=3045177 RepID=A0ABT6WUV4_9ACTN|nr:DoxX family protein [Actinoplanes sandaracinus]MDI6103498.1 DoxX family protein [Actinoplanes sandaracinus]